MSELLPSNTNGIKPGTTQTFYGPAIMLFVLSGLLFGILFRELNKKYGIPYSPLLIILGIFLGNAHEHLGWWGQAAFTMEGIHPHTGMSIFVPTLVFTGALGANFYMFKKSLVNILILSIPGVILGAVLLAFVLKVILGYGDDDLNWMQAITLGCALSSTDPVALVALLKEFGTTSKFNTLLEGQSLISGAFSMILYYLLLDVTNEKITNVFEFSIASIRLTAGGIFVGLLFGFIVSSWLRRIIQDHSLSIIITIIGSYLAFYLCQFTWLKFGGVAAVVIQGLYLSTVVKRKIYHESQAALDTIWSTMAYCGQTVLFILIGTISGIEFQKYETLTRDDYIKMLLFWGLMIIVRAIVIFVFYPILQSRGYGLSKKELVVLIYGGLKGGLGLSLAMMITVDPYYPARFRQLATLYMEGMVLMTVIINGLTCKKVMEYVEMIRIPQIKVKLLKKCIKQVLSITQNKYEQLKGELEFKKARWSEVQSIASIYRLGEVQKNKQQQTLEMEVRDSIREIHPIDLTQEIRFRFTRYLKKTYWDFYEQGQLSEEAIKILTEICDVSNDNSQKKLAYFEFMEGALSTDTVELYLRYRDSDLFGSFFSKMLVSKLYLLYEVSIIFVEGCQQTIRVFKNDFPIDTPQLNEVVAEAKDNTDLFFAYIGQLQSSFPDVISAVHTRRASTILLRNKKMHLKKMYDEGFVDETQYHALKKQVDQSLLKINHLELTFQQLRVNEVLLIYPLFESLSKPQIEKIKSKSNEKTYDKNQIILEKQAEFHSVYIILSGSVREDFGNFYLIKSTGSVINPYDFTWKRDSKCQVKALSSLKVMEIKSEVIDQLLQYNVDFKKKWFKSLFVYESYLNESLIILHKHLKQKHFRRFVDASQVRLIKSGEKDYSEFGSFLFEGEAKSENEIYTPKNGAIAKQISFQATKDSVVFKFSQLKNVNITERSRVVNFIGQKQQAQEIQQS